VAPDKALAFGVTHALFSIMLMGVAVNWTAAALPALGIRFQTSSTQIAVKPLSAVRNRVCHRSVERVES
jgi:heme O synthase-like polyprenyltransferase